MVCQFSACLFQFFQTLLSKQFGLLRPRSRGLTLLLSLLARPTSVCRKLPLLFELLLHGLVLGLPVVATDPH